MTRFVVATGLIALLALPAASQQVQDDPLAGIEGKIGKAIDKGVEWLKKQQLKDGCFTPTGDGPVYGGGNQKPHPNKLGNTALALLALLKSDVEPTDPVIQNGFKFMYEYCKQSANPKNNYERAVTLMAIEALYEGMVNSKLRKQGKRTERAGDSKEPHYSIGGSDLKVAGEMLKAILNDQTKKGGWRYGDNFVIVGSDEDISATQIMLLGLKSAQRMKLQIGDGVWDKAMKFILESQEKDGPKVERQNDSGTPGGRGTYVSNGEDKARGWAYELKSDRDDETRVTGAMSCAGLGSLLICKGVIGKKLNKATAAKVDQCIFDGFAWVMSHFTVTQNPFSKRSHFYYLYGIERVGTMGCFERIGKHIWFTEGAKFLVDAQEKDGKWTDDEVDPKELYATCFALLFLKKGTVPIGDVITDSRFSGGGTSTSPTPVPQPSGSPEPQGTPDPAPSPEPGK